MPRDAEMLICDVAEAERMGSMTSMSRTDV
jgi:hypothetical protein